MTPNEQDAQAWDDGQLGQDEAHAAALPMDAAFDARLDEALGLQAISIRLERSLIEDFKLIASAHGLGYQPLMRQALKRFAESEKNRILRELLAEKEAQAQADQAAPAKPARTGKSRKAA